jgi:thioredoxin reductase
LAIEGSHLLAAIGRRPNTDRLGLDKAGIATDARGFITVDETLSTSVPGVWALGDVNGRAPSPTPRTTTSRSSPATCSTARRGGSATASRSMPCSSIRRSAASA